MCRSNGSRVDGSELGAGREVRNLIVVALAGSSEGRSPRVFTVQRSTPQATRPVAADVRGGCDAQATNTVASATRASTTPTRRRARIRPSVRPSQGSATLSTGAGRLRRLTIDDLAAWTRRER